MSPDSGISSLPSPVDLPEHCLPVSNAMVLRSQRLVRAVDASDRYDNVEFVTDASPKWCLKLEK